MLIPFVVLQELDQLKRRNGNSDSVSSKASRAIRYIYDELKSKNPRLQGNKTWYSSSSYAIPTYQPQ